MAKQKGRRQVYRPRYSAFYSPTRGYPIALGDQYGYECAFFILDTLFRQTDYRKIQEVEVWTLQREIALEE